jgi:hypothetical protein
MRMTLYKIRIIDNKVYIRTIFKTKEFDINRIDNLKETASGGARAVIAYIGDKKVFRITNAFTNFELTRELLFSLKMQN